MKPHEFLECLAYVNWTPEQLADLLGCDIGLVMAWATSREVIPPTLAAWLRMLAKCHETAGIPTILKRKTFKRIPE